MMKQIFSIFIFIFPLVLSAEELSSWNQSASKEAIVDFVQKVTAEGSPHYVAPSDRIAVFDNDGTLWSEKPVYFQLYFAIDRVRAIAPEHPEWSEKQPFKAVLENDMEALLKSGERGLLELVMASHAGMTTEEFAQIVREWINSAKHPELNRPYTELVFQPMLELLDYLRENQFKTYIVSGGGIEFMRVFSEEVYGVPPEQVIGSAIETQFQLEGENASLLRLPKIAFIDDKEGKPVGIHRFIGKKPIAAFGNSDGDLQMLQWTHSEDKTTLCMLVHHTDSDREWSYDRDSHVGNLDKAWDQAELKGWFLINMKNDWKKIYPEKSREAQ